MTNSKPERHTVGQQAAASPAGTASAQRAKSTPSILIQPDLRGEHPLRPLYEINERCLELLVHAARNHRTSTFPLVAQLRELLRNSTPETRSRAARRAFLLVDMEFRNLTWWRTAQTQPNRQSRSDGWRGSFSRRSAVHLARATLIFAWHSLRADQDAACILLGMPPPVADVIASLQLADIDRIAERRFRHIRPRWEDRPAIWRQLLLSASTPDIQRAREFNLRALQLLISELLLLPNDP